MTVMHSSASFLDPDTWHGGYYELSVRQGERSDDRLVVAARSVWSRSDLLGPDGSNRAEPSAQDQVMVNLGDVPRLYGVARISDWSAVACTSVVVREEGGTDWFDLGLPLYAFLECPGGPAAPGNPGPLRGRTCHDVKPSIHTEHQIGRHDDHIANERIAARCALPLPPATICQL